MWVFRSRRATRASGRVVDLRSFARSSRAVELLEPRRFFAAQIVGSGTIYPTIQAAVNAAVAGQTITVDAGVYSELVTVTKQLTIKGPRAGIDGRSNLRNDRAGEAIVNGKLNASGTRGSSFYLNADNIVLDGFTIEGQNTDNTYGAGIHMGEQRTGIKIFNNVVQNNATGIDLASFNAANPTIVRYNLFRTNNQPGQHTGRAIYSNGGISGGLLTGAIIDENAFIKNHGSDPNFAVQPAIGLESQGSPQTNITISNNVFDYNGKGVLVYNASGLTITGNVFTHHRDTTSANLRFEGGVTNVNVTNNLFYANGGRAIRVDEKAFPADNSGFKINANNIFGNGKASNGQDTGLYLNSGQYTGTLDATNNWWGSTSGPSIDTTSGSGDTIWRNGNSVTWSPWATAPFDSALQSPYTGAASDVTGPINFVDYDHGGSGVAWNDAEGSNLGNQLHLYQGVDIVATADNTTGPLPGYAVAYTKAGEWIEYTVNVPAGGSYDMQLRVANANSSASPGTFHVEVDGVAVTGVTPLIRTGSTSTYGTQTINGVSLPAGEHVLRIKFDANGSTGSVGNFSWFKFVPVNVNVPPAAPSGLAASATSSSQINLTWTDNAANESGFIVERSLNGIDGWTVVGTPLQNATSYNDLTVSAATKYYYRVRATSGFGDSANSNVASATTPGGNQAPYITPGSTWKYLDNGTSQGTAWRAIGFDDAAWKSGLAQLGYGDGDEATVVGFGGNTTNKYVTTYFRKSFTVADPAAVSALAYKLLRDDGAVVYLNGTEVFRNNLPTGTISNTTLASATVSGTGETTWLTGTFNPALLVAGTNVIAVEIHQDSLSSSDISFDFELTGTLASTTPTAPAAPTNLVASPASPTQINLTWADNANNETGFIVERSPNGVDNWTQIATPLENATGYDDTGLVASTQYFYRVRATNAVGPSNNSNVANATTPAAPTAPAAPSGLGASAASSSQINLTWTDNANNETGFIVERSPNGVDGWTQIATPGINATSYNNTDLSPSTQYFYRVRATNSVGDSANSNVANATTQATPPTSPTLIAPGATWRYLDNGSNQGTAWRALGFDGAAWKSGAAQLGYGDGDEATVVGFGGNTVNKYVTTYFRKNFSITDPAAVSALAFKLIRDDGVVIYLNGTEVYRNNLPTGTISNTTLASATVSGTGETTWLNGTISPGLLVAGNNVIAVEIHQDSLSSSDISFDFELTAVLTTPSAPNAPTGLAASAASSSQINLTWTDNANNETGFIVERSPNGVDNWTQIATPLQNATSYNDTGLTAATTYYYRVHATNGVGPSANSNVANATTQSASSTVTTVLAAGSIWKYLDIGVAPAAAWRGGAAFDDSSWKSGAAQLGYGDGDEQTVVGFGGNTTNKFVTTYFRKTFTVDNAAAVTQLAMRLLRDDGAVVYLNGTEVYRNNMPTGTITNTTLASSNITGTAEAIWLTANLPLAALVSGTNTIAVEIHQDSLSSSDISFDIELKATANATTPAAMSVQPTKSATDDVFSQNLIEGLV